MALKSLALAAVAVLALGSASFAAAATDSTTPAQHTATTKPAKIAKTAKTAKAADAGFFTAAEMKSAVAFAKMKDGKDKFANAKIDDTKGNALGSIKEILVGKTGLPTTIHLDTGTKVVSISAKRVNYVQDKDTLYTTMTKAQVDKLKALKNG
jgi:hypothetical protein